MKLRDPENTEENEVVIICNKLIDMTSYIFITKKMPENIEYLIEVKTVGGQGPYRDVYKNISNNIIIKNKVSINTLCKQCLVKATCNIDENVFVCAREYFNKE